jgi:hypothetical protein
MIHAREIQAYISGVCVRGHPSVMNYAMGLPRQTFWRWLIAGMEQGETIYLNQSHINRFNGARV